MDYDETDLDQDLTKDPLFQWDMTLGKFWRFPFYK